MDERTRDEIKELVRATIAENALEFRKSTSSVEVGTSASGKPTFTVKVYGNNPTENANRARILVRRLKAEYFGEPFEQPEPYPEPTPDELGQMVEDSLAGSRLKSPAEYAGLETPSAGFDAATSGGAALPDGVEDVEYQDFDEEEPF